MILDKYQKDYFTNKKFRVTFILSLLVFMEHFSTILNYKHLDNTFVNFLDVFFHIFKAQGGITAVPVFFAISAALFYRDYTYNKTLYKYKQRFFSLVIPYLFWNIINTAFILFASNSFMQQYFIGREPAEINLENIINGIFLSKYSIFWFIKVIIVFTAFCPLIYTLLKNKYIGIVVIIAVWILRAFGIELPDFFFRSDSIFYYLIGAYIGIHHFELFKAKMRLNTTNIALTLICFISSTVIIELYHFKQIAFINYDTLPLIIVVFIFSLWRFFDLFKNSSSYSFEQESFIIYAIHVNFSACLTKLLFILLPVTPISALVNSLLTIFVTIFTCCIIGCFIKKRNRVLNVLFTGRNKIIKG